MNKNVFICYSSAVGTTMPKIQYHGPGFER